MWLLPAPTTHVLTAHCSWGGISWHMLTQHLKSTTFTAAVPHNWLLKRLDSFGDSFLHGCSSSPRQLRCDSRCFCNRSQHSLGTARELANMAGDKQRSNTSKTECRKSKSSSLLGLGRAERLGYSHPQPSHCSSSSSNAAHTTSRSISTYSSQHAPHWDKIIRSINNSSTAGHMSMAATAAATPARVEAPANSDKQVHNHPAASSSSSSSSSSSRPAGASSSAPHYGLRQVPDAPGTPPRISHAPHVAARHHLKQYLASIDQLRFVDDLAKGIREGNRLAVSRSLTLCESSRPDHALQAAALLRKLIDNKQQQQQQQRQQQQLVDRGSSSVHSAASSSSSGSSSGSGISVAVGPPSLGNHPLQQQPSAATAAAAPSSSPGSSPSLRVGLSGPPGAGKSSLIETWGCYLADHGSKVAVLAVDPSSVETGGAILGDKTRMARLSSHPNAFVRPSPARGTLGGVSRATYDAMVICEAAGYDKVLVETVGVGQSEVAVADLVDCMLLVMPPVGGDDLQMIKRGIMEVADVVLVNKADGHTEQAATRAASEYGGCLHLMPHRYRGWEPQVLAVSAHTGKGVPALARLVAEFQQALTESGELEKCRTRRAEAITWLSLEEQLLEGLRHDPHVRWLMSRLMPAVRQGSMAPRSAADIALTYFYQHCT